ncbi:MAG TPA: cupin domain-containing protein [Methanomassiliicoccales archaeon]|nr:cupin domain-containing protein [Methanomassiliicoccales archaeon]
MPVQKKERMEILGKKLVLKDLLSYQDGAIVSRTLIDKKAGTVTLFAFDEGQGLSEHAAPYDAMVEVLDGEVEISIDRAPHQLRAGDMIVMPANHPHAVRALTPFKMLLTMIRSEDTPPSVVAIS